ncbi:MAG TPA: dienelactone hydrolase family protein [Gemmatimonadales bacterium]|nr:dienelactone hydrolase family protein [Gemmatimonadales bacterium]
MPRDPHKDQPILQGGAPFGETRGALILLHGRGGSAQEMLVLARELTAPTADSPTAASLTAFFVPEAAGRQWYPFSLLEKVEKNQGALNSALGLVKRIMEKAAEANIPPERIALLGFSQGATVALEYAARNARRYGAVIALSGALLGPEGTPRDYEGSLAGTPLFLGSGDRDPNIPKRRVDETATVFERLGATVTKQIYEGLAHAMNADEVQRARQILAGVG